MYIPTFNQENDKSTLHALIQAHPLGTWTTLCSGEIVINHIPFLLRPQDGEFGTLIGHVARANPVWRELAPASKSVVVFQGPQSYITPSWYPSKQEHAKVVPTWNYAVVHAHGHVRVMEDKRWLLEHLVELTQIHENDRPAPWRPEDAPQEFIDKLLGAIVGIEIRVNQLFGKWKLGQNRNLADRQGVVDGLSQSAKFGAQLLAELTAENLPLQPKKPRADPNKTEP